MNCEFSLYMSGARKSKMAVLADSVLHTVLAMYSQAIAGMKVEGRTKFPHVFSTQCQDLCQSGVGT